jgi:hypothetical protein
MGVRNLNARRWRAIKDSTQPDHGTLPASLLAYSLGLTHFCRFFGLTHFCRFFGATGDIAGVATSLFLGLTQCCRFLGATLLLGPPRAELCVLTSTAVNIDW